MHVFEKAGLGKAPFKYVGMEFQNIAYGMRVLGEVGGCRLETKPGGTCEFCGTYIVNMFNVESADGKRFHVGCECIKKTGDAGLVKATNADIKKAKAARDNARIETAKMNLALLPIFGTKPHPNAALAANGKTLLDYLDWMFINAGTAGKLRAAKIIETMMKVKI